MYHFLMVLCVGLQSVIVAFLVHIHVLFTCAEPENFSKVGPPHTTVFFFSFFVVVFRIDEGRGSKYH